MRDTRVRIAEAEPDLKLRILAELKITQEAEFNALPLETIRAVAGRILPPAPKKKPKKAE